MPIRLRRGLTAAGVSAVAVALVGVGATSAAGAPATRQSYPGSVPSFVSTAADAGATAADTTVEGEVYLDLQDEAGAQKFATAVSTPGSGSYRQYLSAADWIAKYAPSQSDFDAVEKYLTDSDLTISGAPDSREYIVFRGSEEAVSAAFGTTLHKYTVGGTTVTAAHSAPSLPTAIARSVTGIDLGNARVKLTRPNHVTQGNGLNGVSAKGKTSAKPKGSAATQAKNKAKSNAQAQEDSQACSTYFGEHHGSVPKAYGKTSLPTYLCGYLPSQLRTAGNLDRSINSGYDGSGQTIGIVDAYASPTIVQDTNDYMRAAFEPLLSKFEQIAPDASEFRDQELCGGPSGWQGEETLDVQSAHSVAPGAKILYSGGFNCGGGMDLALSKIIDGGLADIVSNSYGYHGELVGNDVIRGQQNIHIQAAGEGIGLYFSSGDDGDESTNLGYVAPDWPATSPYVTAVGGTSEYIGADGQYLSEVGWGDILDKIVNGAYSAPLPGNLYGGGAGGGISTMIAQPAYQKGVVPAALAGKGVDASRVTPDIADLADPYTGFQIALRPIVDDTTLETGPLEYETYGGTSLASPLAAAKMALVQQQIGKRIGFANPALYAQAERGTNAFHDVTTPTTTQALSYLSPTSGNHYLVTLDQGLSLKTRKGYDDITGVGSLKVPQLAKALGQNNA
jgi:subtilase family serine protease